MQSAELIACSLVDKSPLLACLSQLMVSCCGGRHLHLS